MRRWWRFGLWLVLASGFCLVLRSAEPGARNEVQRHGVVFEQWIRDTFFDGYAPTNYTQRWDIPAAANRRFGGIPVNPKAVKLGSPVDLGDALRQFDTEEPFLLIVGFWEQDGPVKRFVNVQAVRVEPAKWRELWQPVTREALAALDATIKDASRPLTDTRAEAQRIKRRVPFTKAVMQVNPKIDAKQRRLQCSLRFRDFFDHLAPAADRGRTSQPALFGVPLPQELASPPRTFRKPAAQ